MKNIKFLYPLLITRPKFTTTKFTKTKTVEMSRSNVTRDTYYSVKILYSEKTTGHTERITYVNRERDARIGH